MIQKKEIVMANILIHNEIKKAIARCEPTRIAVAFIGEDWKTFMPNHEILQSIIVSPTIGSNPEAITHLAQSIGWDKIFFLDELHAKIYIGKESAIVGSANLTNNGLDGERLIELCVEINDEENLKKINRFFDELVEKAKTRYPSVTEKKIKLNELYKIRNSAISNCIIKEKPQKKWSSNSFENFEFNDQFYVAWYQKVDLEYSNEVKNIADFIENEIHFSNKDHVEKNKWVLAWPITYKNKPHKLIKPFWLYIHEIFENGIIDEGYDYPKLAIQRSDKKTPRPPFELTDEVVAAFRWAVQDEEVAKYLIQSDREIFDLSYSNKGIPLLIKKMKEYLAKTREPQSPLAFRENRSETGFS